MDFLPFSSEFSIKKRCFITQGHATKWNLDICILSPSTKMSFDIQTSLLQLIDIKRNTDITFDKLNFDKFHLIDFKSK